MLSLPVTSTVVAIAGLMLVILGLNAGLRRVKTNINLGTDGDAVLLQRVRAHGNFIEYTPIGLILLALVEIGGATSTQLWIIGGFLLVGRALHAIGLIFSVLPGRVLGMLMTFGSILYSVWSLLS